jgi:hypothetical protein
MDIGQFCSGLKKIGLTQTQEALAILWAYDEKTPDIIMSAGEISKIIYETGLGSPNSTQLGERLKKSGMVIPSSKGFSIEGPVSLSNQRNDSSTVRSGQAVSRS